MQGQGSVCAAVGRIEKERSWRARAVGGSDPGGDDLHYAWELNGDGLFDDAAGETPTVPWATLAGLVLGALSLVTLPLTRSTSVMVSSPTVSATTGGPSARAAVSEPARSRAARPRARVRDDAPPVGNQAARIVRMG